MHRIWQEVVDSYKTDSFGHTSLLSFVTKHWFWGYIPSSVTLYSGVSYMVLLMSFIKVNDYSAYYYYFNKGNMNQV